MLILNHQKEEKDVQENKQTIPLNRNSGGGIGEMAPPQIIISPPQPDNSNNSLLSSFMTSKTLTPSKEPMSTEITPYKENKALDFVMGGTPQKKKNN